MSLLEILFLIAYVGLGAGIPLLWYAKKVSPKNEMQEMREEN